MAFLAILTKVRFPYRPPRCRAVCLGMGSTCDVCTPILPQKLSYAWRVSTSLTSYCVCVVLSNAMDTCCHIVDSETYYIAPEAYYLEIMVNSDGVVQSAKVSHGEEEAKEVCVLVYTYPLLMFSP